MKIVVTGALGHIGSRFIHSLRPGEFDEVLLVDNLSTQRYSSLFRLPQGVAFRFVEADVCEADLPLLFRGMDAVIHLAAITNAAGSFENQVQVERVNVEGTARVARACVHCGCRLVFPSSTSVYGTQEKVVDEKCGPDELRPQSPYADSKLRAEDLLKHMGESEGLEFVTCRLGTIYGTSIGMRFHTAINKFCWQANLGLPLTVWRTALHQRRPYLDLGDAVRAMKFILEMGRFDRQVYNVLTDNCTVGEIVERIRSYVPDLRVEFVDSPIMNQLSYTVACEKFKSLGFGFTGNLDAGIRETLDLLRAAGAGRIGQGRADR